MEPRQGARPRFWIRGLVPAVLIGIGFLHSIVGISGGRHVLVGIARDGFWDTVHGGSGPITRPLLLWFLVSGFVIIMLGHLALWVERHIKRPLPSMFGVELLAFAVVLGIVSGGGLPAWLFAGGAVYILLVAGVDRRQSSGDGESG